MNSFGAPDLPLVSVITVVRNGAATILKTLESVRTQHYTRVEHIVIDGASSDGTVDILKGNEGSQLRWISECDNGIYDAMNKGISLAKGEWLLFLGADDVLADPDVLSDVFASRELGAYDLVCGTSQYTDGRKCVPRLDWHTRIFNTIHHQAAFYRRQLFEDFKYRSDIPVVADYELNFRIYFQHRNALFIDRVIAVSDGEGISYTSSQFATQIDMYKIRDRYMSKSVNIVMLIVGVVNLIVTRLRFRLKPLQD